jgi:hypothetical protein
VFLLLNLALFKTLTNIKPGNFELVSDIRLGLLSLCLIKTITSPELQLVMLNSDDTYLPSWLSFSSHSR